MRGLLCLGIALFAACTDDGGTEPDLGLPPPECQPDSKLRYVHDLGGTQISGELPPGNYAFVNMINNEPGQLSVGDPTGMRGGEGIYVEFITLVARGASSRAQGYFNIGGTRAGNCETEHASKLTALAGEGWTVVLRDLHESPYCEGAAVEGSFAACLIPEPF